MSRKRIVLAVTALVAGLLLVIGVLWTFPVLRVSDITVSGSEHTPEELIVEATGVSPGDNLVRVDTGAAALGVADQPWVRSATVNRNWPSTLEVVVTERRAVMFSLESDGHHLIDEKGVPFVIDAPPEGAVEITGDRREDPETLSGIAEVLESMPEHVRGMMKAVDAPGPHALTLLLHDGRTVFWGSSGDNHDKSLALEVVLQREGEHWNISHPAMVTVR